MEESADVSGLAFLSRLVIEVEKSASLDTWECDVKATLISGNSFEGTDLFHAIVGKVAKQC